MNTPRLLLLPCSLACLLALAACGGNTAAGAASPTPKDPKGTIAQQLEMLKAGDLAGIKAGLTERQRERVTAEMIAKAKDEVAKYTLDELVDGIEEGTDAGKRTAKIKMKNGRTLTTMIETDGRWLADTIWFK